MPGISRIFNPDDDRQPHLGDEGEAQFVSQHERHVAKLPEPAAPEPLLPGWPNFVVYRACPFFCMHRPA
jgi:hypothetical protein